MKKIMIPALALTLGACQSVAVGTDGYRFDRKEYENVTPGVEFVLLQNSKEMAQIRKEFFGADWARVSAFTQWNPEKGVCKIYIADPDWQYKPELIGHEVAHCIWGRWHVTTGEPVGKSQE